MAISPSAPFLQPVAPVERPRPPDSIPANLLFKDRPEVLIAHNGETYRLRITRNGKLILTK